MSLMTAETMTASDRRLNVGEAVSVDSSALTACIRGPYSFTYSDGIIITDQPFYGSLAAMGEKIKGGELRPGTRFLLQSEAYAIEQSSLKQGIDPRKAVAFGDYFGKNKGKQNARELTLTAYRMPKTSRPYGHKTDSNGNKKYLRTLIEPDWKVFADVMRQITEPGFDWRDIGDRFNREVRDLWLPEGGVIVEFDDFGNPAETRNIPWPHESYYAHFTFNPNQEIDKVSKHHDVAVERGGDWRYVERCLAVGADYGRWGANSRVGFRPVRGSVPEVRKYRLEEIKL